MGVWDEGMFFKTNGLVLSTVLRDIVIRRSKSNLSLMLPKLVKKI